jgi:hypothetical protein
MMIRVSRAQGRVERPDQGERYLAGARQLYRDDGKDHTVGSMEYKSVETISKYHTGS